jgi:hypothetical protein
VTDDDFDSVDLDVVRPPPRRTVTFGNAAGRLKERGDDVYPTPPAPVEALLRVEKLPHHLWEPAWPSDAAGRIAAVLRGHGHKVTCSDLRGDRIDFLMEWRAPEGVEAIVTNAPFKLSARPFNMGGIAPRACRSAQGGVGRAFAR